MKTFGTIFFLLLLRFCSLAQNDSPVGSSATGQVVWWGTGNNFSGKIIHTNGLFVVGNEFLSNVVAVAAKAETGLALRSDNTLFSLPFGFGRADISSVSNVVSLMAEESRWVIKRDGTVSGWGGNDIDSCKNIIDQLHEVTAIKSIGFRNYVVLKSDGTVLGMYLDNFIDPTSVNFRKLDYLQIHPTRVNWQFLSNVVALATIPENSVTTKITTNRFEYFRNGDLGIITLKNDGRVLCIEGRMMGSLGDENGPFPRIWSQPPFQYGSADPVMVGGQELSNVVALAGGGTHCLALKSDGTVVAFGNNDYGQSAVPADLSDVIAIAAAERHSLALKHDGTVVAWGDNHFGQTSVPAGLSNVAAIAAGGNFSLAVTTGSIPTSVFIQPRGRLEEMLAEADLVFKGQVLSSDLITNWATNSPLRYSQLEVRATKFKIISVLKGQAATNEIVFQHYGDMSRRGGFFGGGGGGSFFGGGGSGLPAHFKFETGESYLIFAATNNKAGQNNAPLPNTTKEPNELHMLMGSILHTFDSRPLNDISVKDAHWFELNLLLNDSNPTNQLYAIDKLNSMSLPGGGNDKWSNIPDFKRKDVLSDLLPIITNSNEQVASRAINCFAAGTNSVANLEPFANALLNVATGSPSSKLRLNAISALSGTRFDAISNSLAQLLNNSDDSVRSDAVGLLAHFPGNFSEQALRDRAKDESPKVRATVAEVIGNGKITNLLSTLDRLFSDPVGLTNPIPPLTVELLQAGGHIWGGVNGDVHTSAGYALLKFDVEQVGEILKANLSDRGFGLSFIRKLAPNGEEPYFPLLAKELKTHTANSEQEAATNGFHWPLSYWLSGNYGWAWDTLFGYVSAQSSKTLANPQITPMLDALMIADDPGDARTRSLYAFFLDKGLTERAKEVRRGIIRRMEDKAIDKKSFNFPALLKAFDEMDAQYSFKGNARRAK